MSPEEAGVGHPDTTLHDVATRPPRVRARLGLAGIGLLVLIVVAGAIGVFGVHESSVAAEGDGYSLDVVYAKVARAGLDVPFRVEIHHAGGFSQGLTIAVSTNYFRMFETQGFFPEADTMRNDGRFVYFSYDKAPGDEFVFDYDTYVQPSSQIGKSAVVEVIVGGVPVASVSLRTWLLP